MSNLPYDVEWTTAEKRAAFEWLIAIVNVGRSSIRAFTEEERKHAAVAATELTKLDTSEGSWSQLGMYLAIEVGAVALGTRAFTMDWLLATLGGYATAGVCAFFVYLELMKLRADSMRRIRLAQRQAAIEEMKK